MPRFLLPRYTSVPSTLKIAFILASVNSLRLWNCAQHAYSQLTFRRQRPSRDHRWSGWPLPPTIKPRRRRRWKIRGARPPPVIRPPNAAANHQFVGAQLYRQPDRDGTSSLALEPVVWCRVQSPSPLCFVIIACCPMHGRLPTVGDRAFPVAA